MSNIYLQGLKTLVKTVVNNRGIPPSSLQYHPEPEPEQKAVTAAKGTKGSQSKVSQQETIDYQKREIGKELLLLEKHLQGGCRIGEKPCDCCGRHSATIEALSDETLGITADPIYGELHYWITDISSKVTESASASGKYSKEYPKLATEARGFRKRILGSDSVAAVLSEKTQGELRKLIKDG